ncbi:MAG: diguanylate cyclase [Syntrophales bacterium]
MNEQSGIHQELIEEISVLKQRIQEVEKSEAEHKRAEELLKEGEERFHQLFDNMADGVAIYQAIDDGSDFIFVDINRKGQLLSAISRSEAIGKRVTEVFPAVEKIGLLDVFRQVWRTGEAQHHPLTVYEDGRVQQWVENYVFKLPSGIIVALYSDTTEKHNSEEALRESEEKYRFVVENAAESILIAQDGLLKYVNPMTVKLLGYSEEVLTSMPFVELIHPEDMEKLFEAHIRTMRGEENQPVHQFRVVTLDGTVRWADSRAVVISWEGKPATLNFLTDTTERKRAEEVLRESENRYRELSIVDDLTQLYNSRHFYFQLKIELDRSNRYEQPLTLLLLDLDNFKAFNDAYGHVEGDQVLLRLGQVVKRCLRETDFAYRYGGEEFTILLPMTTSADGPVAAERIRTEFKKEIFSPAPGQDVHVTVSIGLAQYKPQEDIKTFVHRVDQLMYQGKKNGKDRVCSES